MKKRNTAQYLLSSLLGIFLLCIYLSADLVGSLHSYFVHEEQSNTVCSIDEEQNTCHRAVYHHDTINGCHHPSHLSKPIVKCELCSMLLAHHVLPVRKNHWFVQVAHVPVIPSLEDRLVTNPVCAAHSLRGPPSFS